MGKFIKLFTIVSFIIFLLQPGLIAQKTDYSLPVKAGPHPANLISMDFQDANLKTVLKIFSQQSGLNFVASQNVQDRTVTIYFDNVSVEDALNHIMRANSLVYELEEGSNIFIVKESGKPVVETITKIYELKYAQLSAPPTESGQSESSAEILTIIQGLLSTNGTVIADKRSNSLIIKDVPSQFSIIEDVLTRLDVRTPQVMIEVEVIETTTTVANDLGMDWTGTFGVYAGPIRSTLWPWGGRFGKSSTHSGAVSTEGSVSLSGMGATLKALLSNTDTKILARPKILTLNNETATIELTSQTAVASVTSIAEGSGGSSSVTSTGAERIETGITLNVTPQINKDGYITMYIEPTVIVPVLSSYFASGNSTFVDPQTRSAKTTVTIKDGETIVIGGLISKQDTYGLEKIPFLGDLPFLGWAFRYKDDDKSDKELMIFITPHIMKDTMYALGDISEREQDKPELIKKEEKEKEINTILDLIGSIGKK